MIRGLVVVVLLSLLAGCAGGGGGKPSQSGGRYAMASDAYPNSPEDVANVPDAVPRVEPRSRGGNRASYTVRGKTYRVLDDPSGYVAEGNASWYGVKFQGYDTANGDTYDMYQMSAAHRSLPLPTYARVTNLDNGRTVIVRINDRGPFHENRLIDLSYAAAARLDILGGGTGRVRVEAIDPAVWARSHGSGGSTRQTATPAVTGPVSTTPEFDYAAQIGPALEVSEGAGNAAPAPARVEATPLPPVSADRARGTRYVQVAALESVAKAQALKSRLQGLLSRPVRIDNAAALYRVQVGPILDPTSLATIRTALSDAGYRQTFVVSPPQ